MANNSSLKQDIFDIKDDADFRRVALEIFRIQSRECAPYAEYISILGIEPESITDIASIPFLPVRYFKSRNIICATPADTYNTPRTKEVIPDNLTTGSPTRDITTREDLPCNVHPDIEKIFTSSTTTGMVPARHLVKDISIYEESFLKTFSLFFGPPKRYTILALLPSYLEREGSSLVYMADKLIELTEKADSGFYLYNFEDLYNTLLRLRECNEPTILLGVTFALLDFVEKYRIEFPSLTIMETGGMKGRGSEISRNKLHSLLTNGFGVEKIASEYGMAELLSQAYSFEDGLFRTPPWMRILIRDINNPFRIYDSTEVDTATPKEGGINIVDLANINSCSFIETEDMGIKRPGNMFTISGRISNSERRGCNMLLE